MNTITSTLINIKPRNHKQHYIKSKYESEKHSLCQDTYRSAAVAAKTPPQLSPSDMPSMPPIFTCSKQSIRLLRRLSVATKISNLGPVLCANNNTNNTNNTQSLTDQSKCRRRIYCSDHYHFRPQHQQNSMTTPAQTQSTASVFLFEDDNGIFQPYEDQAQTQLALAFSQVFVLFLDPMRETLINISDSVQAGWIFDDQCDES
jgi:hypothetical protein